LLIRFGGLDPESELIGVQKRLNNLGYYCGDPDGTMNDSTREALRAFQLRFSLPQTGVADDATKELLRQNNDEVSRFPIYPPDQDSDPEGGGPDA
jgi:peptidoglycan hydrolase-like protein with peptidoglycan-binding domain